MRGARLAAQFAVFEERLRAVERAQAARAARAAAALPEYIPVFFQVPEVPENVVEDGLEQLGPLLQVLRSTEVAAEEEAPEEEHAVFTIPLSPEWDARSLVAHGWGGTGKATACVIVAHDELVRAAFPGGVVFLQFGESVTDEQIVRQMRQFVVATGGHHPDGLRLVDAIDKVGTTSMQIGRVFSLVAHWIRDRRVLFIANNLNHRAAGVAWPEELTYLVETPGNSLLYSTRSKDIAECAPRHRRFPFRCVADPVIARKMFCGHAAIEENVPAPDPVQSAAIDAILATCAGWHVAIRMAGNLVHNLAYDWPRVLEEVDNRALVTFTLPDEPGVGALMSAGLQVLGDLPHDGMDVLGLPRSSLKTPRYFQTMYAKLAVLGKTNPVPLSLLAPVFGCDEGEAEAFAWLLHRAGLATVKRVVDAKNGHHVPIDDTLFSLHPLQLQFASHSCASSAPDASVPAQHWLFLEQCCALGAGPKLSVADHNWGMFSPSRSRPRDEYIRNHLFWHLTIASRDRPADVKQAFLGILSNFEWLRGRICADGFMALVSDCNAALAAEEACRFSGEERTTLHRLRHVVMGTGGAVSPDSDGNFAAAIIQRAGLLPSRGDRLFPGLEFSERLAETAERAVRGAWLRPLAGCSRKFTTDARVLEKVRVGDSGSLFAVAALGDGEHVLSAGSDGKIGRLRVHRMDALGAVLDWSGRGSLIRAIAVASSAPDRTSFTVFSGGEDEECKGCVRSWEIVVDTAGVPRLGAEGVVGECGDDVNSLAVSENGLRLAAGCKDGLVFIWSRSDSLSGTAFNLVTSFPCAASDQLRSLQISWVTVAVSGSGAMVVAGTWAGDLCFWEYNGDSSDGNLVRVASTRPWEGEGKLEKIVLVDGESSAASFFSFPAGVEIWDVSTKSLSTLRTKLDGLDCLQAGAVTFVPSESDAEGGEAVSQTRFLVAANYEDGGQNAVLEFDSSKLEGGCVASYETEALALDVCYVTIGGARRAVAGCSDGALLLLDVSGRTESSLGDTDEREGGPEPLDAEVPDVAGLSQVCAVAVMVKSGLVLAGHDDGVISWWCAKSGNYEGRFTQANAEQVLCLDVCENENMVVSGHAEGSIIVWLVDHWHARLVMRANSRGIISLTISADATQIISVDDIGDVRSWDPIVGGDLAWAVSSGLGFSGIKYVAHQRRACRPAISRDGKLFVWAMRDNLGVWKAKLIDVQDGREVKSLTDVAWNDGFGFYRFISDCLERDGVSIGEGWRFGASFWGRFIELQREVGEEIGLKVSPGGVILKDPPVLQVGGSRVRCFLEKPILDVLSDVEFDFGNTVGGFAAGWIPQDGNSRRRHQVAVIACWVAQSNRPAILHRIPVKT